MKRHAGDAGDAKGRQFVKPLILLAAALAVFALVVHNLKSPAVGTIVQTPPDKSEPQDPYAEPSKITGAYISYEAPAHYRRVAGQLTGSFLQVDNFFATDHSEKQISIGVTQEDLNSDTGYNLRQQHPSTYSLEPMTRSGAYIFSSSQNGVEKTAFVSHSGYVASISLSAPAGWDLSADLQTILDSLEWHV